VQWLIIYEQKGTYTQLCLFHYFYCHLLSCQCMYCQLHFCKPTRANSLFKLIMAFKNCIANHCAGLQLQNETQSLHRELDLHTIKNKLSYIIKEEAWQILLNTLLDYVCSNFTSRVPEIHDQLGQKCLGWGHEMLRKLRLKNNHCCTSNDQVRVYLWKELAINVAIIN